MDRTRREFLAGAAGLLIALPAGFSLLGAAGCGDDNKCAGAGKLVSTPTTLTFTSSCDGNHTHDFALMVSELSAPPSDGVERDTTADPIDQHTHTVTLTMADLAQIQSGMTVNKTSSSVLDHTHTFAFRKA